MISVNYSSENIILVSYPRKTLIIFNAVHWFAVILYSRSVVHRSSGFIFVRRQPSSVVFSRQPSSSVRRSFVYRPLQPSSDRSASPLDYDITIGSHANLIEQVPLQSCRKRCIVLSSAGPKKTTPSPSTLGSNYH